MKRQGQYGGLLIGMPRKAFLGSPLVFGVDSYLCPALGDLILHKRRVVMATNCRSD